MSAPLAEERAYLHAAGQELPDYLLSPAEPWQLGGPSSWPPLTPGYVLLYRRRVSGWPWPPTGRAEVETDLATITAACSRWPAAWARRAAHEYPQRLRLWQSYVADLQIARGQPHPEHPWRVRWRVILALLEDLLAEFQPGFRPAVQLIELDRAVASMTHPGPFLWEAELAPAFPLEDYPYLYQVSPQ